MKNDVIRETSSDALEPPRSLNELPTALNSDRAMCQDATVYVDATKSSARSMIVEHQARDHAAFERLVKPTMKPLYALCFRLTGNHAAAEDLRQEAVIRAFKSFHRYEDRGRFHFWLFQIAHRAYADSCRKLSKTFQDVPFDEIVEDIAQYESALDPFQSILDQCDYQKLYDKIGTLSKEQQEIIRLRYGQGLTYEACEEMLNMPKGTFRSRLSRAIKKLKF